MFHLLGFGATTLDASAGDVQLNAAADDQYSIRNNAFQIPVDHNLYAMYMGTLNMSRGRINTASNRQRGNPQIWPFNIAVLPASPLPIMDLRDNPIKLYREEDFRVDISAPVAANSNAFAVVSPEPLNRSIPYRDIRILRFTASVTAVANAWSNFNAITFQDTIEGGNYAIYGMHVAGANVLGARLSLQGQFSRPGCVGSALSGPIVPGNIFMGGLGTWGFFNTYSVPLIQTMENAAGASTPTGWLMVAKAG